MCEFSRANLSSITLAKGVIQTDDSNSTENETYASSERNCITADTFSFDSPPSTITR